VTDRLCTADEIAEMLAVPVSWVRDHTRAGHLPHVTLGRYKRYRLERVVEWIEEQERGGAAWQKYRPAPELILPRRVSRS
jgi:excisionase family DNA binding protein